MDKKRIFIAIPASSQMQRRVMDFSLAHAALPVRWLQPKNLHITLLPPHELDVDEIRELADKLNGVSGIKPFEAHFKTVDFGNNPQEPRLIWAHGDMPTELKQLKGEIANASGWEPDNRDLLHITIARFRAQNFQPEWRDGLKPDVHWTMLVNEFAIYESRLLPPGADFTILHKFPLA